MSFCFGIYDAISNANQCACCPQIVVGFTSLLCFIISRRCRLTVFGFSLAAFEIMFINMTRRHSTCESGRASLDFNGFCESLIAIGQRKLALNMRREPVHILLTVLKHCEEQLGKTLEMSSYRQIVEPLTPPSGQNLRSCFHLPTRTAIK